MGRQVRGSQTFSWRWLVGPGEQRVAGDLHGRNRLRAATVGKLSGHSLKLRLLQPTD
jgi:hypothetical protein